ncbi:MAG: co-chaperone GroES family protein [Candidatus Omnitrophica bacterium]|nr:co-chaperone GroES family protein [Candidatus Omnitrophota bacterium]
MGKELIVVGDRVIIEPDQGHDRTDTGLYLPQGVKEKEKIQSGTIVKAGPGYPIPDPASLEIEPWEAPKVDGKYFPLQAKEGDFCIFLRSAAIDIEYEGKKYLIVPHSAILVLLRE